MCMSRLQCGNCGKLFDPADGPHVCRKKPKEKPKATHLSFDETGLHFFGWIEDDSELTSIFR